MFSIFGFVVALIILLAVPLAVRGMGRKGYYWLFVPANTFARIVTDDDGTANTTDSGGNIVDALHSVPGKILDKSSTDHMNWEFKDDGGKKDPDHAGLFYEYLGLQSMASVWRKVGTVRIRNLRFAKKDNEELYHTTSKDHLVRFVHFSGEQTVSIKGADTADGLGVDFEIDLIGERTFPIRSTLRLADSNAYLTSMAEEVVNNITGGLPASAFFSSSEAGKNKKIVADALETEANFKKEVLDRIGFTITSVNVRSAFLPDEQMALLRRKIDAETQAEADLVKATNLAKQARVKALGDKDAQISINDADADRVKRVLTPIAADDNMSRIHIAEVGANTYRDNKVVTTYAPGNGGVTPVIPVK